MQEEPSREDILRTGFSEQDLESGPDGRDTMREFIEDYETVGYCLSILRVELEGAIAAMLAEKKSAGIVQAAESGLEGVEKLLAKWRGIIEQAELFKIAQLAGGQEVSVKQHQLDILKDDLRDWFNLTGGIKNMSRKITHDYARVQDLGGAISASVEGRKEGQSQYYGRGFSEATNEWEVEFAKVLGAADVALCNSGMSAIEACLRASGLKRGDTILVGKNFYVHTNVLLAELQERQGVEIVQVDFANLEEVGKMVRKHNPKLVLFEDLANAPSMETAEMEGILKANAAWNSEHPDGGYRLVIDNTFASPTLLHVPRMLKDGKITGARWAVLESATKYYQRGMDNITAGVVYSDDAEYMKAVKGKRTIAGLHLQERLAAYLPDLTPEEFELMRGKLARHSMNALYLAKSLEELGLRVSYPGLESHPHHDIAVRNYPQGQGGVFYINWNNADGNPQEFVNAVRAESGGEIKIGVSFGHPETWLETMPPDLKTNWSEGDTRQWNIRVMAGEENAAQIKKVAAAFATVYQAMKG